MFVPFNSSSLREHFVEVNTRYNPSCTLLPPNRLLRILQNLVNTFKRGWDGGAFLWFLWFLWRLSLRPSSTPVPSRAAMVAARATPRARPTFLAPHPRRRARVRCDPTACARRVSLSTMLPWFQESHKTSHNKLGLRPQNIFSAWALKNKIWSFVTMTQNSLILHS